jgi:hypothetical protein
VRICPVHQFAFQSSIEKAKKMMLHIGQIIHLQTTICSAGGIGLSDKHLDSIAVDILPHPLSLFHTFLHKNLAEENWNVFRPQPGELRIYSNYEKISLAIFVSMNARPTINSFQIVGTDGTIHLNLFHDFAVMEREKCQKREKILHPFDLSLRNFSAAAINLIRRSIRFETAYPGCYN